MLEAVLKYKNFPQMEDKQAIKLMYSGRYALKSTFPESVKWQYVVNTW